MNYKTMYAAIGHVSRAIGPEPTDVLINVCKNEIFSVIGGEYVIMTSNAHLRDMATIQEGR